MLLLRCENRIHRGLDHLQRHGGDGLGVVRARLGDPAGDHVGVADGLDLLQAVALRDGVEAQEDLVEAQLAGGLACWLGVQPLSSRLPGFAGTWLARGHNIERTYANSKEVHKAVLAKKPTVATRAYC